VLAQLVDADVEVLVVDGMSTDETAVLAKSAGATVIDNPDVTIPAALNRGLEASRGGILARFDGHAEMPPGYLAACVRALEEEPGAGNVGGWRLPIGEGQWGRAVAAALETPLGVGNHRIWKTPRAGDDRQDVDTVPLGCFPVVALRSIGGWDRRLLTNEDYELNHRLRVAGWRVVFDPAIWSVYRPRESLAEVAAQYWRYGLWKSRMLAEAPSSLRARQLAPPLLVAAAVASGSRSRLGPPARMALATYGAVLASAGLTSSAGWRTGAVLAAMHFAWGSGLLYGTMERSWTSLTSLARPSC
jgi:glycosyltransferase involved in cell wall biosynthesis